MKKPRRIFYLVAGVTTAMSIAAACSFPEPNIIDDGDGGGSGTDGPTGDDVDAPDALNDGARPDVVTESDSAPPIGDATSEKPAVDANCNVCDCDNDGYKTRDAAICPDAGGPRLDCDDIDERANPDSGFRDDLVTQDTKGDWNCDGKYNLEYPVLFKCSDYSQSTLGSECTGLGGFSSEPPCGEEANFVVCKNPGGLGGPCLIAETVKKKQRCK